MIFDLLFKDYYRTKGQKYLMKGKPERAYRYFEKALLQDSNSTNMYNFALVLLALGRRAEAKNYLSKVLEEMPNSELVLLTLADLEMQDKQWDKAEDLLTLLTEHYPNNNKYQKYLGRVKNPAARENYIKAKDLLQKASTLLTENKTKEALQSLQKAEKLDPENPYIQNNLGFFYLQLEKNPKKALTYFQRAYQLEPDNKKFQENLYSVRRQIKE
ncbi:MAG: tetratricopeptide repeat protein [Candidatus Cloacimonas sp.]|nr:tetratricopeptide repeat protein [Candidatus Cloacimonadota bacterium]